MTIRPSHRRLQSRLAELALSTAPVGYSTDPSDVDENFVARLQSLAIASSIAPAPRSTRIRKQVGAVIGAVGILGWAGAAAAGAGVGAVTCGAGASATGGGVAGVAGSTGAAGADSTVAVAVVTG